MTPNRLPAALVQLIHDAVKTEWYPGGQHPARSGVYEVERAQERKGFRYFDGVQWYYGGDTPDKAMFAFQTLGIVLHDCPRWRGLREEAV